MAKTYFHNAGRITDETMDPMMFEKPYTERRKRQLETFTPVFSSELNFTDEERALCGDDHACLFDLAVTGSKEFAMTTLDRGETFSKEVSELSE